jgi:hypothetical protein
MAARKAGEPGSFERGRHAPLTFDYAYVDAYVDGSPKLGGLERSSIALDVGNSVLPRAGRLHYDAADLCPSRLWEAVR